MGLEIAPGGRGSASDPTPIVTTTGRARVEREAPPGVLLREFENDLLRISGVMSARIIGDHAPTEIHIVAASGRSAKQLVRDVQSLAAAAHGITIDHRIVSVVQLDAGEAGRVRAAVGEAPRVIDETRRPRLERVVFASKGHTGWVRVHLDWPDGEMTEGEDFVGATRESRARGAARALERALEGWLSKHNSTLDIENIVLQRIGESDTVIVLASIHEEGGSLPLVGSALIYDDVATAAVLATLQALNRKLG